MSEEQASCLTTIHERDQMDATVADISRAVARHYRTLIDSGVPEKRAGKLTKEMQWQWLQGIVPASPLVAEMMREDDGLP